MAKEANATEAPTNQTTLDNVEKDFIPLSEKKVDFVTIVVQHHSKYSTLMTVETADERYGIDPKDFKKYMGDGTVKEALKQLGVDVDKYALDGKQKWRSHALTPLQLMTADAMLNLYDNRSETKKLSDLGVKPRTYQAWLRDPVFSEYLRESSEQILRGSQHEASMVMLDRMRAGDHNFLKTYLEYTGRFVPKSEGTNSTVEIQSLITGIIEIIIDEVEDPETSMRIADKLKKMITARNVAGALLGEEEPLAIPEVQEARQLSPHMQSLLEQGRGIND